MNAARPPRATLIINQAVADRYEGWLASGVHVVTPNKKANSGDLKRFKAIRTAATSSGAKWLCEGTIGAGLPIVSTLRTLRASGDEIRSVQGVFSGAFCTNVFHHTKVFHP
jgi:aspartokinase/homoserine dehydrogenase 1